jgi:hypothetical protein
MYGTIARYTLKPGMKGKLLEYQAKIRSVNLPGLIGEFTLCTDEDANVFYEAVVFESQEAYQAVADSPEQDQRYQELAALFASPPEWHDGEIINFGF